MAVKSSEFSERVALVTGANRGIGEAIALDLGEHGAYVVGAARTDEGVETISRMLDENDLEGMAIQLDIADYESIRDRIRKIVAEAGKPVSLLVNNAGITADGPAIGMKESWDNVIGTNLTGTFRVTQNVVLGMLKAKKRGEMPEADVATIGSVVGEVGEAGQVNYAAAKAGLIGMTKAWAKEHAGEGIRFNIINPGFVDTRMTSVLDEERVQAILSLTESGQPLTPEQIAEVVRETLLAGQTGQVVTVDDGIVEKLASQ
ncbi:MAG TPA: SDR family NAD(P)-dependent oxidoreductase [Candidatus Saccharimonadales bacterium]|nr:SDR family NAD(P)-dependent oxidoreductase [Candidatus Saccharimonadales bacterium]